MKSSVYRVGLLMSDGLSIDNYELPIDDQKCKVHFYDKNNQNKYCDLIITDQDPEKLSTIPSEEKNCHGISIIINKFSNPSNESKYSEIFDKAQNIKYRSIYNTDEASIKTIINSEFIKNQVKEGRLPLRIFLLSKFTRKDLWNNIWEGLGFLLLPFFTIVMYYLARLIFDEYGYKPPLICWFIDEPDCKTNSLDEIKFFVLFYASFNLIFYCNYILNVFDNMNNDVFEYSPVNKRIHKPFQLFCFIFFFLSALTLLKSIFVFKNSFSILNQMDIDIASFFNIYLPLLKDDLLIYYFLSLDFFLLLLTNNFYSANQKINYSFTSIRQLVFLKDAKESFIRSVFFTLVLIGIFIVFSPIFDDKSKLVYQITLLQLIYLYININSIFSEFKHR